MAVELVCDQGDRLRLVLESVHDFAGEARITFRPHCVEVIGQDTAHVVVVRYVLTSKKIREIGGSYEFSNPASPDSPIEVGIRTKVVAGCLKCSPPGDTVSIRVDPAIHGKLILVSRNATKITRWEIVTPTLSDDDVDSGSLESLSYSGSITMSSGFFHDMLRDLSTASSSTVKLYCDGTRLVLTSDGLMAKVSFEVTDSRETRKSEDDDIMDKSDSGNDGEIEADISSRTALKETGRMKKRSRNRSSRRMEEEIGTSEAAEDEIVVDDDYDATKTTTTTTTRQKQSLSPSSSPSTMPIDDEDDPANCCSVSKRKHTAFSSLHAKVPPHVQPSSAITAIFTKNVDGTWPVSESYAYKFLSLIAKAKNLSSRITICIRPNFPAAFFYDSPVGTLTFIVAPREDEDDGGFVVPPEITTSCQPLHSSTKTKVLASPEIGDTDSQAKKRKIDEEEEDDEDDKSIAPEEINAKGDNGTEEKTEEDTTISNPCNPKKRIRRRITASLEKSTINGGDEEYDETKKECQHTASSMPPCKKRVTIVTKRNQHKK